MLITLFAALECVHMQTELGVWLPCIVMHQSQGRYRRFFPCLGLPSSLLSSQLARAHSWGRLDQPGRESIQEKGSRTNFSEGSSQRGPRRTLG